jgi:hypothetical protein
LKRLIVFAALAASIMVLPASSSARTDCPGGGPVSVVTPVTTVGGSITPDAIVGACVDTNTPADGGYVEIGSGGPGTYAVIDGSDALPGNAAGYGALSTYESGGKDTACDANDTGSGTNSGGCLFLKPVGIGAPVPLIACGNTSGPDWANAGRDGCAIP